MQKTIFITGASSGLGKATAKLFQSRGWKVIATMRNPASETELNQASRSLEYNTLPHYKDLTESMFGSFEHSMQRRWNFGQVLIKHISISLS